MKINRTMTIETNEIQIGDRIQVGHYTATCQALPGEGLALFLLDQYLDKAMQMNKENTNDRYNSGVVEPDDCEQWPPMKERANRVAERKGESYEWGWLQNKYVQSATGFCRVGDDGIADGWSASGSIGVRPAFLIKFT